MPELPEVETVRRQLSEVLPGQTITNIQVLSEKSFQGDPSLISPSTVSDIRRAGKVLIIDLETGNVKLETGNRHPTDTDKYRPQPALESNSFSLVIHLKMTGQLIYDSATDITSHSDDVDPKFDHRIVGGHPTKDFIAELPSSHTRVIFTLSDFAQTSSRLSPKQRGGHDLTPSTSKLNYLYFNDQRKFGWIKLVLTSEVEKIPFIAKLGPEPWEISLENWNKLLASSRKAVKVRLLDQDKVAGIGNIYANDALWEAQIHPSRPANSLSPQESELLLEKVKLVMDEGIYYGGATAADGKYVDIGGLGGSYQEHFRTYDRAGQPCKRPDCDGIIQKITLGGRGTYFCPDCQQ